MPCSKSLKPNFFPVLMLSLIFRKLCLKASSCSHATGWLDVCLEEELNVCASQTGQWVYRDSIVSCAPLIQTSIKQTWLWGISGPRLPKKHPFVAHLSDTYVFPVTTDNPVSLQTCSALFRCQGKSELLLMAVKTCLFTSHLLFFP